MSGFYTGSSTASGYTLITSLTIIALYHTGGVVAAFFAPCVVSSAWHYIIILYLNFLKNAGDAINAVDLMNAAVEKHKKDEYQKYLKKSFSNFTLKGNPKAVPLTFCFVTINPQPDIALDDFVDKIKKCTRSLLFADFLASIEQRGTTDDDTLGKGFHAYILFRRHFPLVDSKPPTQIKRDLKTSFKKYCDIHNNNIFNIQFIGSEFAADKKSYILGNKDLGKKEKTDGDKKWRALHNIPDTLGNLNII